MFEEQIHFSAAWQISLKHPQIASARQAMTEFEMHAGNGACVLHRRM